MDRLSVPMRLIGAGACALLLTACGNGDKQEREQSSPAALRAELARTSFGIVHVRADDFRGLGYGLAYAYAQDNVCMFADTILTVRGERSRYFGPTAQATAPSKGEYGAAIDYLHVNNEVSDFFFKGYLDIAELRDGYAAGSQEARDLLAGYAAGYNRYLKDYAGRLPAACSNAPWVGPISVDDMYLVLAEKSLHASGEVFAQEIVDGARDGAGEQIFPAARRADSEVAPDTNFIQRRLSRLHREPMGSNAVAIGKDLSDNGSGMLLGNPHYPWTSTDRFYQAHLSVGTSYDAMGVILGGIPIVVIGFNQDLAWTHTVSTSVHFTTFRVTLDPRDRTGTTYLVDGVPQKMTSKTVGIAILQPDGSLVHRNKTFYRTGQGAVMVKADAGLIWSPSAVHVLADANRGNTRLLDQWIALGRSRNVSDFKAALDRHVGLPWVNALAADRFGNTLFADASAVPFVTTDKFASDCFVFPALLMFDAARSTCAWASDARVAAGIFSPTNAPFAFRSDYVANSNDSYWLNNSRALLTGPQPLGFSPLYGPVAVPQMLRTRIGFRQLDEAIAEKGRLRLVDLQELAFANRVHAAELILDEFVQLCQRSIDVDILAGCDVLSRWDRRANLDSRGAVLFREFWNLAAANGIAWAIPFDARDPVNTPRGLPVSSAPAVLAALKTAVQALRTNGIALDGPLGLFQTETRNGIRYPLHGAIGDIDGSYNSIHMRSGLQAGGYQDVAWGTSYVQTVGFDSQGPVAHAMLVYGQSVDPHSAHYADQLPLYSQKRWPRLPFTDAAIKADPAYQLMTLSE